MSRRLRWSLLASAAAMVALLLTAILAPYVRAEYFGKHILWSLERALGRHVEMGPVHFSLFTGPGFSVDKVIIHEDPAVGIEPVAYVEQLTVVPRLWALARGRLEISSIRLSDCDINLVKTGSPAEEGRWNFQPLVDRAAKAVFPAITVRGGRINFKFGDVKSVVYLMNTDLDISPPARGGAWRFRFSGAPARTDRPAQGLGVFTGGGRWIEGAPSRMEMDLALERTGVGELLALLHGDKGGVHGMVSARLRLAGPPGNIGISGQLRIEDVHRWDMLPPKDSGWPLYVRGKLDLAAQVLELESSSTEKAPLPLSVRFRISDYLARPHWGVALNWNRFALRPLLDLARHMGLAAPAKLDAAGTMDGALSYSSEGGLGGTIMCRETSLTIPDSPPVRFAEARVWFDRGHAHLARAVARSADDQAAVEADYDWDSGAFTVAISTEGMQVASLRAQAALAAVPWLEQVQSGAWSGELRCLRAPGAPPAWSGLIEVRDGVMAVPGLAHPLQLGSARARIDGARISIDRLRGTAGDLEFTGEYRYEPQTPHPHRFRVVCDDLDLGELEKEIAPTLRRGGSFIARALGRAALPDWLRERRAEGTVQAAAVTLGGVRLDGLRARVVWDAARVDLENLRARVSQGQLTGRMVVNLRLSRPSYRLTGAVKGLIWQSGKVDAEGFVEASGAGAQLLATLNAEGKFSGEGVDLGVQPAWQSVSGAFRVTWAGGAPRLRFTDLELAAGDDAYTGRGGTAEDGRLILLLTDGTREVRATGTLARLKVEEPRP